MTPTRGLRRPSNSDSVMRDPSLSAEVGARSDESVAAFSPSPCAPTSALPSPFLPRLRLHGRDGDGVHDVFGLAAAREVVGGAVEPLKYGADGGRAREPFGELVRDVARLQVREDEHVRAARDRRA